MRTFWMSQDGTITFKNGLTFEFLQVSASLNHDKSTFLIKNGWKTWKTFCSCAFHSGAVKHRNERPDQTETPGIDMIMTGLAFNKSEARRPTVYEQLIRWRLTPTRRKLQSSDSYESVKFVIVGKRRRSRMCFFFFVGHSWRRKAFQIETYELTAATWNAEMSVVVI